MKQFSFKILFFILFIIYITPSKLISQVSQQWAVNSCGFGNSKIVLDTSGNCFTAGNIYFNTCCIVKINREGNVLWSHQPGMLFYDIETDHYGHVLVSGMRNYNFYVEQYNSSNGSFVWSSEIRNGQAYSVSTDKFGNVYATGYGNFGFGTDPDYFTVKLNSQGIFQWESRYDGTQNNYDEANAVTTDDSGNVYVTGQSMGMGTGQDFLTIKYNSAGVQQWVARYNGFGNGNEEASDIAVDRFGNVYVTGYSMGNGTGTDDHATLKYSSSGNLLWAQRYNSNGNYYGIRSDMTIDSVGNVFVVGGYRSFSTSNDYIILKYNPNGNLQWANNYNGPGNGDDNSYAVAADKSGNAYVTGRSLGISTAYDFSTLKYSASGSVLWEQRYNSPQNYSDEAYSIDLDDSNNVYLSGAFGPGNGVVKYSQQNQSLSVTEPAPYSKFIAGETDTIKWLNQGWTSYNIKCILNYGTPIQSEFIIDSYITDTSYIWNVQDSLLSFRSKIIVQNSDNVNQSIESEIFRIKPYLLTKLNPDSTYYEYSIGRDNWRYENRRANFWFEDWYDQFNYWWIDPFTGRFYPRKYFKGVREKDFPDWVSWVNAFTIQACYSNFDNGEYSPIAVARWKAVNGDFQGSCFGLALSNAMSFNYKSQFNRKYHDFPGFTNPHDVEVNNNVRKITNELFTHQFGQPHKSFLNNSTINTFPSVTLNSLKDLLMQDNCIIKMLGIANLNDSKGGAHMILPYKVERSFGSGYYRILTYDNNFPDTPTIFVVNTLAFAGNGFWTSLKYSNWGGPKGIILSDEVYNYFFTPVLPQTNSSSPFTVDDSLIQIYYPGDADFIIEDDEGYVSGTINDSSFNNIENCNPVYAFGGFEGPPYMFNLLSGSYSVTLKNFNSDKIESFLFTGNKSYSYSREQISSNQTDKLFFDGNLSVLNEDSVTKQITLSSIVKESTDEKVISIKSLSLPQNDSIKLVNILDEAFKLITFGTQKQYELELNYVTPSESQKFINSDIVLSENSSHTIMPEWNNISSGTLTILEDIGNNGTIDDTINLNNFSDLNIVLTTFIEGLYDDVINRMISDSVTILLREKIFPFAITDSARAVLSSKGKGYLTFRNAQHLAEYYIVVKHRNAIEIWSNSTISLSGNSTNNYSFVDSASFAYGSNLIQVDSYPLSFALYSGDVNQDRIIDGSDQVIIDNDAYRFATGYLVSDLNGDSIVDASDAVIADNNAYNFVSVIRP